MFVYNLYKDEVYYEDEGYIVVPTVVTVAGNVEVIRLFVETLLGKKMYISLLSDRTKLPEGDVYSLVLEIDPEYDIGLFCHDRSYEPLNLRIERSNLCDDEYDVKHAVTRYKMMT
jgi:hypothetical protein